MGAPGAIRENNRHSRRPAACSGQALRAPRQSVGATVVIRRFVLLSVLLHSVLVMLPAAGIDQSLSWPAPELSISLRGAAEAPAVTTVTTPDTVHSSLRLSGDPSPVQAARSANTTAMPATAGPLDDRAAHEQRLTNQLQSLLRAELRAHFVYPPLARRQGWQGRVRIAMHIEADGRFSAMQVLRSSGYSVLDADAVHTLQRIGQLPQARDWFSGRSRRVEIPVVYRLLES